MKYTTVSFLVAFLFVGFITAQVQTYPPVMPYKENSYTKAEVLNFALGSSSKSSQWREIYVQVINDGLKNAGETLQITEDHIGWSLDSVRYEYIELDTFTNTRWENEKIEPFEDYNFKGTVAVFYYGKCRVILFKTICLNFIKELKSDLAKRQTAPVISQPLPPKQTNPMIRFVPVESTEPKPEIVRQTVIVTDTIVEQVIVRKEYHEDYDYDDEWLDRREERWVEPEREVVFVERPRPRIGLNIVLGSGLHSFSSYGGSTHCKTPPYGSYEWDRGHYHSSYKAHSGH